MKPQWIFAEPGSEILLLGNISVARGAIEAGVNFVAAYPGTPSSEIMESLLEASSVCGFYAEWSVNEKVAIDNAAGAALVGARSLTSLKTAGLNVAADTFMTIPYSGIKGGLVVVVADDPEAHYSSTEHDSRLLAVQAEIPCLEPSDSHEAKEMTRIAFDLSEESKLPIMVRLVSRLSHGSSNVILGPIAPSKRSLGFNKHYEIPYRWNVYGPPGAKSKHEWLHTRFPIVEHQVEESSFNRLEIVNRGGAGIIASGIGSAYAWEVLKDIGLEGKVNWLKVGTCYPLPLKKVREVLENSQQVLVIEEGDPFVESRVRLIAQELGCLTPIYGRQGRNRFFSPCGEINTDMVMEGISSCFGLPGNQPGQARKKAKDRTKEIVAPRSSTLCAGCPHLGSYWGLRQAVKKHKGVHIINGDIGCYEQAGYGIFSDKLQGDSSDSRYWPTQSLYETLDTLYVMGSGIGMAEGQVQAGYTDGKVIAIAGDSTFFHACLPALVNAVYNNSKLIFMVLDNKWTAMTGQQPSLTSGVLGTGESAKTIDIVGVCKALGVEEVFEAYAFDVGSVYQAVEKAIESDKLSVIVVTGECEIQAARMGKRSNFKITINLEECNGCRICTRLGCPAIGFDTHAKKATIDELQCVNCNLCPQVCEPGAIKSEVNT